MDMELIQVFRHENVDKMTYEYLIVVFGLFKIRRTLRHYEVVIADKLPLWFRVLRWFKGKPSPSKLT